jgi:hypothetical protein
LTPRAEGFDGVKVALGAHYRVPLVVHTMLESRLPHTVMPVVWYVIRNTIGRRPETHSSIGHVAVANKEMARLFGPANVTRPMARGRRPQTVRRGIDWCVEQGILDRKRRGDWTELSVGSELWHVLRKGEFSPRLSALLGGDAARAGRMPRRAQADDLDRVERLLGSDGLPLQDVIRMFERARRAS